MLLASCQAVHSRNLVGVVLEGSEFAAGTLQAQLGHFGVESGRLNLAETRVRNVPGEGLEPSRGKPSQDFKSCSGACEV